MVWRAGGGDASGSAANFSKMPPVTTAAMLPARADLFCLFFASNFYLKAIIEDLIHYYRLWSGDS